MNIKKTHLATALVATFGASAVVMECASAASLLQDGNYQMVINNTPYSSVNQSYVYGTDGAWNSGFTTGCQPGAKGCASCAMDDFLNSGPINGRGGSISDGVAGRINITVANGVITSGNLFQVDNILYTAGGDFAQYTANGTASSMTGAIDAAGNMTFTPTNRLGTFSSFPALVDERWNVDNFNNGGNTAWNTFTTGAATNNAGTTHGTACSSLGGGSYGCVLVSASQIGSDWGGFFGATVSERWNITLSAVPIPAAVWLFGSGLVGLLGIARRKKSRS